MELIEIPQQAPTQLSVYAGPSAHSKFESALIAHMQTRLRIMGGAEQPRTAIERERMLHQYMYAHAISHIRDVVLERRIVTPAPTPPGRPQQQQRQQASQELRIRNVGWRPVVRFVGRDVVELTALETRDAYRGVDRGCHASQACVYVCIADVVQSVRECSEWQTIITTRSRDIDLDAIDPGAVYVCVTCGGIHVCTEDCAAGDSRGGNIVCPLTGRVHGPVAAGTEVDHFMLHPKSSAMVTTDSTAADADCRAGIGKSRMHDDRNTRFIETCGFSSIQLGDGRRMDRVTEDTYAIMSTSPWAQDAAAAHARVSAQRAAGARVQRPISEEEKYQAASRQESAAAHMTQAILGASGLRRLDAVGGSGGGGATGVVVPHTELAAKPTECSRTRTTMFVELDKSMTKQMQGRPTATAIASSPPGTTAKQQQQKQRRRRSRQQQQPPMVPSVEDSGGHDPSVLEPDSTQGQSSRSVGSPAGVPGITEEKEEDDNDVDDEERDDAAVVTAAKATEDDERQKQQQTPPHTSSSLELVSMQTRVRRVPTLRQPQSSPSQPISPLTQDDLDWIMTLIEMFEGAAPAIAQSLRVAHSACLTVPTVYTGAIHLQMQQYATRIGDVIRSTYGVLTTLSDGPTALPLHMRTIIRTYILLDAFQNADALCAATVGQIGTGSSASPETPRLKRPTPGEPDGELTDGPAGKRPCGDTCSARLAQRAPPHVYTPMAALRIGAQQFRNTATCINVVVSRIRAGYIVDNAEIQDDIRRGYRRLTQIVASQVASASAAAVGWPPDISVVFYSGDVSVASVTATAAIDTAAVDASATRSSSSRSKSSRSSRHGGGGRKRSDRDDMHRGSSSGSIDANLIGRLDGIARWIHCLLFLDITNGMDIGEACDLCRRRAAAVRLDVM